MVEAKFSLFKLMLESQVVNPPESPFDSLNFLLVARQPAEDCIKLSNMSFIVHCIDMRMMLANL